MHCLDVPCERKVHGLPVPKVGGLAMAAGVLLPVLFASLGSGVSATILVGAGVIVLFGFLDDMRDLGYLSKLAGQLAAAITVVIAGGVKIISLGSLLPEGVALPDMVAIPLTLLVIVGVTNAVNLADGLDGLAGGIMLMSYLCIGFLAYSAERSTIVLLAAAGGGAIFGFLRFNTYPASVFMGDAGSQLLGFLAITMSLTITQDNTPVSPLFPLLLLGLPILDTLSVMTKRAMGDRPLFAADKNHLHHKLLRRGLYHNEAVFAVYMLQAALVTVAFLLRFQSDWLLLAVYLVFGILLMGSLSIAERRNWSLKRPGALDHLVKTRLKIHIRDRMVVIKVAQALLEMGFPLLLVVTCLVPGSVSGVVPITAGGLAFILILVRFLKPTWTSAVMRASVYFFMPLVIYLGEVRPSAWIPPEAVVSFNLSFGLMTFLSVITLRSTRRREGFKVSPLDFLILFIAAVAPNLPDKAIQNFQLGLMAAKVIIFFVVFEVLIGELRGKIDKLGLGMLVAFAILASKQFGH